MPKISVLPDGSALAGTETTPLVQAGATVKHTWNTFANFVVAYNVQLSAIAGLTSAADRVAYFTGSGTAALATFTAAGRALVDDADASAQLTTLGVSTFVKTILDDADAAAVRATIGAAASAASGDVTGPASAVNLHIAQFDGTTGKLLKDGGALGTAAAVDTGTSGTKIPLLSAANTWTLAQTFTAAPVFTDASGSRTALGLAIGTNVQAWDADLDALAALAGTDTIYRRSGAATWSAVTIGTGLAFSGGTLSATGFAGSGAITGSGLTMATARLLGRTTASTGAIEEISAGATLSLSAGALGIDLTHANAWSGKQDLSGGGDLTPAAAPSTTAIGYLGSPVLTGLDSGNVAPALTDCGKTFYHTDANARNFTIPANASVAFPVGTILAIENENGAAAVSIIITTDTLRWGSSTGTRTLAANGGCSIQKVASTVWRVHGEGIT